MTVETHVRSMIKQLQQLLECGMACFVPWCPDETLCHPLLDFCPESLFLAELPSETSGGLWRDIWRNERAQSCCDLAIQGGRMQVLDDCFFASSDQVRSIAAFPLERPAGVLGVFLLADKQAGRFSTGEECLLYHYVSVYAESLESVLWEHWRVLVRDGLARGKRDKAQSACSDEAGEPFVKSEFVSMIGHELRAPLSVIKGYAGLLQAYGGTDKQEAEALSAERRRHYLDQIMEQSNLLEVLVNDLLDLSRMQQGRLALHPTFVDVGLLCQQAVHLGQLWADQQGSGKYRLVYRLAAPLAPVWVDANRLRQILMNVIENAIKYSPRGGSIEVEAGLFGERERQNLLPGDQRRRGAQVYIAIRDQGIGISAQHFARLFQPFERLERPAASQIPGSGLGLHITRKLLDAMGGAIMVQSDEGKGTTVTVTLPASQREKERSREQAPLQRFSSSRMSQRGILLTERANLAKK